MEIITRHRLILFLFCISSFLRGLTSHIAVFDEVWEKRAEEAKAAAENAYKKNPERVISHLNSRVQSAVEGSNSTRRSLRRYSGPCMATNPIDRCWRCQKNWATNRKRLANCAVGFGRMTRGGKRGHLYVVTDPSDDDLLDPKPGTLRHAVIRDGPLWITFAHDMIIRLSQELLLTSNKTIDGRGARVHIAYGAGITVQFVQNVIIHGLHIHDINSGNGGLIRDSLSHFGLRTPSDGDGISVFGSSYVWIDHISMSNCKDGLIDVIMGSTAITISKYITGDKKGLRCRKCMEGLDVEI